MISLRGCHYAFSADGRIEGVPVLGGIDIEVRDGEFLCVLGPSGCGKTTLLRILAGLARPTAGSVTIDGTEISGPGPDRAMVFQDHALLPWATVLANVAFGLELRHVPRAERHDRARRLLDAVGLSGVANYRPQQLSGGMQQRVGLARALAIDPSILLMDEPFGSLDAQARRALQEDLLRLHHEQRKTVVFVTHSVDEAARLGDRIVVLTRRPARVDAVFDVALARPRVPGYDSLPAFVDLKQALWARLRGQTEETS